MQSGTEAFWSAFNARAGALREQIRTGNTRQAFEVIRALLDEHQIGVCAEVTEEDGDAVLVLTPEGSRAKADLIDELLAHRPRVDGWRFHGRRQRRPLVDAFAFIDELYGIDVRDATFDIGQEAGRFTVTMRSAALTQLTPGQAWGAVATFLDHAVGEELVMSRVARIEAADGAGQHFASQAVALLLGN